MEFLLGFLGAILAVGLFVTGAVLGWRCKERDFARNQQATAEKLTEAEKRRIKEEQEAWTALHNYSVEDAYNLNPRENTSDKE